MMKQLDFSNIDQIKEYETYLIENEGDFLQSSKWGKVKQNWLHEIYFEYDENNQIVGSFSILIRKIKYTPFSFIYCPRGALIDWTDKQIKESFISTLKMVVLKHRALMFKMEPAILKDDINTINEILYLGFKKSTEEIQCNDIYILDIKGKTKDQIFMSFTSKCRYNIKYAIKNELTCQYYGVEKIDVFYNLLKITSQRDGFPIREKAYFQNMIDALGSEMCRLYICDYHGESLSAALVVYFAGRVSYVYGASSDQLRHLMPNYLMHWTMIQDALKNNMAVYDFLGIPHFDDPLSANYGTFCFKKKFNGQIVQYVQGFDYPGVISLKIFYAIKKLYTLLSNFFTR